MSFLGFLPAILILLFGPQPPVIATLIAETIAVGFLSLHIFLSGYQTHTQPVKIGFFFSLGFAIVLILYLLNLCV